MHMPGRESRLREEPLTSIVGMASRVAAALEPLLDRPYAIYGHSIGAVVAFETVRRLRVRHARMPELFVVSASPAPHLPWRHPPIGRLPDVGFCARSTRATNPFRHK